MYFSILIPVYNQMGKMDKCIESLNNQTFTDFEAIFVDDGSNDGSGAFLDDLCKDRKGFFVYHHETNKSLTGARFTGMEHAKGRYVLFLDSDDYLENNALEEIKKKFDEEQVDIIRFGFVIDPMEVEMMPAETSDYMRTFMEGKYPPAIWKNAYDINVIKAVLDKCKPFYCNMGEDSFFSTVLFGSAKSEAVLNKILYHYDASGGMSQTNAISTMSKLQRDYDSAKASGDNLLDFIEKNKPEYIELGKKAIRHMYRYILCQNILYAKDYFDVVEYLNFFKEMKEDSVFEFGCKELVPYKVKFDLKNTDKRFATLELENLFVLLPEK